MAKLAAVLLVGLVAAVLLVVRVLTPASSGAAADWVAFGAALLALVVLTMTWAILRMRRSG